MFFGFFLKKVQFCKKEKKHTRKQAFMYGHVDATADSGTGRKGQSLKAIPRVTTSFFFSSTARHVYVALM